MQETSFLKTQHSTPVSKRSLWLNMAIATKGEILCVSLHGDYRYDPLKNTPEELRDQEKELQKALVGELKNTPLIVTGYMLEILLHGRTNR